MQNRNSFSFFRNVQPKPFQQALPRTFAPIIAAAGFKSGFLAAGFLGAFASAFAVDSSETKVSTALTIMGASALTGGVVCGVLGYGVGYGGSNFLMTAFPSLKHVESRFLLVSGIRPQAYLFLGTLAALALPPLIKTVTNTRSGSSCRP